MEEHRETLLQSAPALSLLYTSHTILQSYRHTTTTDRLTSTPNSIFCLWLTCYVANHYFSWLRASRSDLSEPYPVVGRVPGTALFVL